jgi:hypothetical protein
MECETAHDGAAGAGGMNVATPLAVTGGAVIVADVLLGLLPRWLLGADHREMTTIGAVPRRPRGRRRRAGLCWC